MSAGPSSASVLPITSMSGCASVPDGFHAGALRTVARFCRSPGPDRSRTCRGSASTVSDRPISCRACRSYRPVLTDARSTRLTRSLRPHARHRFCWRATSKGRRTCPFSASRTAVVAGSFRFNRRAFIRGRSTDWPGGSSGRAPRSRRDPHSSISPIRWPSSPRRSRRTGLPPAVCCSSGMRPSPSCWRSSSSSPRAAVSRRRRRDRVWLASALGGGRSGCWPWSSRGQWLSSQASSAGLWGLGSRPRLRSRETHP